MAVGSNGARRETSQRREAGSLDQRLKTNSWPRTQLPRQKSRIVPTRAGRPFAGCRPAVMGVRIAGLRTWTNRAPTGLLHGPILTASLDAPTTCHLRTPSRAPSEALFHCQRALAGLSAENQRGSALTALLGLRVSKRTRLARSSRPTIAAARSQQTKAKKTSHPVLLLSRRLFP